MTKLNASIITPLPASDSGSPAVCDSKRINPRPQSCLCLTWSGYPSNDDDDDDDDCKTKNNQARFDKDLYLLMVNKNKVFKKYLKKKNVLNKANFNKIRNSYNRALQEKNKAIWHKLL